MSSRAIALLRGINVSGRNRLPMAELRELLLELGFSDAKTLLQTGNIVLADAPEPEELEPRLEQALQARFGFTPDVMVRSPAQWRELIDGNPLKAEAEREPHRTLAVVLKSEPQPERVAALIAAAGAAERVQVIGRTAYVHYPQGAGDSRLSIEGKLKVRGTGRNWNTVLKLADLAGA